MKPYKTGTRDFQMSNNSNSCDCSLINENSSVSNVLTLVAVGDITLMSKSRENPFRNIEHVLKGKDIVFGNLEVVLTSSGTPARKRTVLRTDPEKSRYLHKAGFNVMNIANNHILDYGVNGYYSTTRALKKYGIHYIGVLDTDRYLILEKKGIRIGFLGYSLTQVSARNKIKYMIQDVSELKKLADIVIVSLHWGVEYSPYPSPAQQKLGRKLIECGADVILGHHPHVVQGLEKYRNGLVVYSLGNFQFDLRIDNIYKYAGTDKGLVVELTLSRRGLEDYRVIPVKINDNYEPIEMRPEEKGKFLAHLKHVQQQLESDSIPEGKWLIEAAEPYLKSSVEALADIVRKLGLLGLLISITWIIRPLTLKMLVGSIMKMLISQGASTRRSFQELIRP